MEEGERAVESQTFQTNALALSASGQVHFFDAASRIRRIEASGRMTTLAGTGLRAEAALAGPALRTPLANVGQIVFSPAGVLHFFSTVNGVSRVSRVAGGNVELVAGSARPGFSGESGPALEVGLGTIVQMAFEGSGALLLIDGYGRIRRLEGSVLRTIAGSAKPAAAVGFTGDNGPGVEASLSNPRQLYPFADGSLWIKALGGRHLRLLTPDGTIRTINQNFESTLNLMALADGSPAGAAANRVYPLRSNGNLDAAVAANPFPPFTGTPLAVAPDGALYFLGNARPEQRNPLVRLMGRVQTVAAGAPAVALVDGQAPPYAIWSARSGTLLFATESAEKFGVYEARAGQEPKLMLGGGKEIGDPEGKAATDVTIFGAVVFTQDGEGRLIVADVYRRRLLVVGTDGKVTVLKTRDGNPIIYAPLGSFGSLQRLAADNAGNIYWYSLGATPTGGVFTADISVWSRATQAVTTFTVAGLAHLTRLDDGNAAVIAGNGANFRTVTRVDPAGLGETVADFGRLPLAAVTRARNQPYVVAASRLFRGLPGRLEMLDLAALPDGTVFTPDFVLGGAEAPLLHLSTSGGFYRLENADACKWLPQPTVAVNGLVNAASFEGANTFSPRQLITVFGSGLGPPEGQGLVLDGLLRAGGQPAPYPNFLIGNFTGTIPNAALSGTTLPVIYSNDRQMTMQASISTTGTFLLYYNWQGLQLIYPVSLRALAAVPGVFASGGVAAALNEDGSRNSEASGAVPGSIVQLFATGLGGLTPAPALGDAFGAESRLTNELVVKIGGQPAEVLFAGGAPGTVGLFQANVRVPAELGKGAQPLVLEVAGQSSAVQQVTVAIRKKKGGTKPYQFLQDSNHRQAVRISLSGPGLRSAMGSVCAQLRMRTPEKFGVRLRRE